MQVSFKHKNGRVSQMTKRYAEILTKLGRGTYSEIIESPPLYSDPGIEELRAEADRLGIAYHHRAGAAKLRELLGK
jgi:hypothetical protein